MCGQVECGERLATDPREQDARRVGMGGKRHEGALVLLLRRGALLQTRAVGTQDGQSVAANVGPESRNLALGAQGKQEIIPVVKHRPQDGLDQEIMRIDQHIVGLETREGEDQMQDNKRGRAEQRMSELEPTVRDCRRHLLVQA